MRSLPENTLPEAVSSLVIHTDGASRGNPGPAGIGVEICDESGKSVKNVKKYIGIATNNVAEYTALIIALEEACALGARKVLVYLDSELIYKQYTGEYRTKDERMKVFLSKVREIEKKITSLEIKHVPRENNKEADKLANMAINTGESGGN